MKLSVLISTFVVAMSIAGGAKAGLDPWCNPSYCPPTPTYPGTGDTTREDTSYPATVYELHRDCVENAELMRSAAVNDYLGWSYEMKKTYYEYAGVVAFIFKGPNSYGLIELSFKDPYSQDPFWPGNIFNYCFT